MQMQASDISSTKKWRWYEFQRRITIIIMIFLSVMVIVLEIQVQSLNRISNISNDNTESVKQSVEQVISQQINSPEAKANTNTLASRQRIANIEYALCGGTCPAAPIVTPNTLPNNASGNQ